MWQGIENEVLRVASTYAWRIVAAAIIVVVGTWLAGIVGKAVHRILTARKLDSTLVHFVDSSVQVLLYGLVIIEALHKLGIDSASLVALVGGAGIAIGLGLRGQLANVAAGLLIVLFRPFSVGHYIEGGGSAGTVERIQLFSTEIRTPDNVMVILPNSRLLSEKIINYSLTDIRRLSIVVSLSYAADLKKAQDALQAIIAEDKRVLQEPKRNVTIRELSETGVKIELMVWVRSQDLWNVQVETTEKIKERFDDEHIPFATQQPAVRQ